MISKGFNPALFETDRQMDEATRISTGSYYTPFALAYWMVSTTLVSHLSEGWELALAEGAAPADYGQWLQTQLLSYKILDPACGSGVFPCAYLACCESLWSEAALGSFPYERMIQNVYVCDIQEEPLALYQEILSQWSGVFAGSVPVYCGDCLSDEAVGRHSALILAAEQGFDFVFGNPPYLGEKSNKDVFRNIRAEAFGERFYEGRMDYFYYFIYRGLEWLKPTGRLCFVTTNYFPTADGAVKLRAYLREQGSFSRLYNFGEAIVFKEAMGQNNLVFEYVKQGQRSLVCEVWNSISKEVEMPSSPNAAGWRHHVLSQDKLYDAHGCINLYGNSEVAALLNKIRSTCQVCVGDMFEVNQGIVSGADKAKVSREGIFVLSETEKAQLGIVSNRLKPLYKNKDIGKYGVRRGGDDWILYLEGSELMDDPQDDLIMKHLEGHRSRLSRRREVISGIRPWYALQWPRHPERFEQPKIIAPQRAYVNVFAYSKAPVYGSADLYYLSSKFSAVQEEDLLYTLAFLNSRIIYFWLHYAGKRKGKMLELYATPLKKIPLIQRDDSDPQCQQIVLLVNELNQGSDHRQVHMATIDRHFYNRLGLTDTDIQLIEGCYCDEGAERYEEAYWRGNSIDTI